MDEEFIEYSSEDGEYVFLSSEMEAVAEDKDEETHEIMLLDPVVSADDYGQFLGFGIGIGVVLGFLAVSISGVFAVLKAATNIP